MSSFTYQINQEKSTFDPYIVLKRSDGKEFKFDIINQYREYSRPINTLYISNKGEIVTIHSNRLIVIPEGIDGPVYRKITQFEFDRYNYYLSEDEKIKDNSDIYNAIVNEN
jgi:hypothetical protein